MVKLLKLKISGRLHLVNRHWGKDGLLSQRECMLLLTVREGTHTKRREDEGPREKKWP